MGETHQLIAMCLGDGFRYGVCLKSQYGKYSYNFGVAGLLIDTTTFPHTACPDGEQYTPIDNPP